MKMEIKKQVSHILCIGLVLSSVSISMQAKQGDDVQEKMNVFQRSLKSFQRVSSRYNRCLRGKCSKEEKQKLWAELKSVSKQTAKYGALVVGAIIVVGGAGLFLTGATVAEGRIRKAKAKHKITDLSSSSPEDDELLSLFALSKNPDLRDLKDHEFQLPVIQAAAELYYGMEGSKEDISIDKWQLFRDKFSSLKPLVQAITIEVPFAAALPLGKRELEEVD